MVKQYSIYVAYRNRLRENGVYFVGSTLLYSVKNVIIPQLAFGQSIF